MLIVAALAALSDCLFCCIHWVVCIAKDTNSCDPPNMDTELQTFYYVPNFSNDREELDLRRLDTISCVWLLSSKVSRPVPHITLSCIRTSKKTTSGHCKQLSFSLPALLPLATSQPQTQAADRLPKLISSSFAAQARPGGLIGELPVGGVGPHRSTSLQGGRDAGANVARGRLGYGELGKGPPVGQIPMYRSQSYSQQSAGQAVGQVWPTTPTQPHIHSTFQDSAVQ